MFTNAFQDQTKTLVIGILGYSVVRNDFKNLKTEKQKLRPSHFTCNSLTSKYKKSKVKTYIDNWKDNTNT